jgi:hypothetical protein
VPFKLLRAMEIKKEKECYKLLKMKMLMSGVQMAAERAGIWRSLAQRGLWDVGLTVRLYEAVRPFTYLSNTSHCRDEQISWTTVYNLYKNHGKKIAMDL